MIYLYKNFKNMFIKKISTIKNYILKEIHSPPKVKVRPTLLFSFFVHNSSINKLKNMKLSEHI